MEITRKQLPDGVWLFFMDLTRETTEQDMQAVIATRTGVVVPFERIKINRYDGTKTSATISFSKQHIHDVMAWALQDDEVRGLPVRIDDLPSEKKQPKQ